MNLTGAPRLARRRTYLAATTVHILRGREESYPRLIEQGKLSAADAAEALEVARVLVAQWRWAVDRARPALPAFDPASGPFGAPNHRLVTETASAAARTLAQADRLPTSWERRELADLCAALAWHQQPIGGLARIVMAADVERSAGAPQLREAA